MTLEEELQKQVAILKNELQKPVSERKNVDESMRRTIQIIGMSPERARKNLEKN